LDAINSFASNYSIQTVDIPVRFTVVNDDNGYGDIITQTDINQSLANLNNKYQSLTGFNFVQCGETSYINKSDLQRYFYH
jgi:hypothetical protein